MDWKAARKKMKLTLKQVADVSGYSIATINALELEGRGSDRLVEKLMLIYGNRLDVDMEEVHADAALREVQPDYRLQMEEWKAKAMAAEKELAKLRGRLQSILGPAAIEPEKPPAKSGVVYSLNDVAKPNAIARNLLKRNTPPESQPR